MEFLSKSVKETAEIAANFVKKLKPSSSSATTVGLYGELGSGKTTFMKYLAESLGVADTIQSPTFVIQKIYDLTPTLSLTRRGRLRQAERGEVKRLIHVDAYRIEKDEEMLNLGWQEIISDPQNLICIEWPERIAKIMPEHIKIFFEHIDENSRKIKIEL